jgi:hypothetical protein
VHCRAGLDAVTEEEYPSSVPGIATHRPVCSRFSDLPVTTVPKTLRTCIFIWYKRGISNAHCTTISKLFLFQTQSTHLHSRVGTEVIYFVLIERLIDCTMQ